jgi:hypothetical protein
MGAEKIADDGLRNAQPTVLELIGVPELADGIVDVFHEADVELVFQEPQRVRIAAFATLLAWIVIVLLFGLPREKMQAIARVFLSGHSRNSPFINRSLAMEQTPAVKISVRR